MTPQVNQHDPQGRPHGVWEDYYPDGPLWRRENWLHGKIHGVSEWYRPDGTLRWTDRFLHGEKFGLQKNYRSDGIPYFKSYSLTIK
jgi:antitoxin component YwqK of YwqJK toxin-antitoxin module